MNNRIELTHIKGATSFIVDAELMKNGDLVIAGQDLGELPLEIYHDYDYEYWLTIPAAYKETTFVYLLKKAIRKGLSPKIDGLSPDQGLITLLELLYAGNISVVNELIFELKKLGIPVEYSDY